MDSFMRFNRFRKTNALDSLINDEKISQMENNLRLNQAQQELCNMKGFPDLLGEAIIHPYFTIFWIYFAINVSALLYHVRYKWHFQSMYQLQFHLNRIRKYIGCVIGMFSFSICWKVVFAIESCYSSIYLVLFSCLLSVMAYFIAYGFKGRSSALVALPMCAIGTLLVLFSVINHFGAEGGQYYYAQSFYGIFILVLGIKLFCMRDGGQHIAKEYYWYRNEIPYRMTEVVIRD